MWVTEPFDWVSFQSQVFYQKLGSLRVLCRIIAVPNTALFWTESCEVVPGIYWHHSPSSGVTALSAFTTTGTRLTFTFHTLANLPTRSGIFPSLSYSFFLILLLVSISTSIITTVFQSLSTVIMSDWLDSTCLSVWIWKSYLFCTTFCGIFHHDLGGSSLCWDWMLLSFLPHHHGFHLTVGY